MIEHESKLQSMQDFKIKNYSYYIKTTVSAGNFCNGFIHRPSVLLTLMAFAM